jgi:SAM-dependent methyltransferase
MSIAMDRIEREFERLRQYLADHLEKDAYPQPPDDGHQAAIAEVCGKWFPHLDKPIESILDVGCGQGQAMSILKDYASRVVGVTMGTDLQVCQKARLEVYGQDMSFLQFPNMHFDMIFARHVLEHSFSPLFTLWEWRRVSKHYLCLVVPQVSHYGEGGRNHYYVLTPEQWGNLLKKTGWKIKWREDTPSLPWEHRYMCERLLKIPREI